MPIRSANAAPPFQIVRFSHVEFAVRDLASSEAFYVDCLGYLVSAKTSEALYLRGLEERNHHSIVLRRQPQPAALVVGFKVASEEDLDRAAAWFTRKGLPAVFVDTPFQRRTLRSADNSGIPLEFYFGMDRADCML